MVVLPVSSYSTPLRGKVGISAWPLGWSFLVPRIDVPRVSVAVFPPELMLVLDHSTAAWPRVAAMFGTARTLLI